MSKPTTKKSGTKKKAPAKKRNRKGKAAKLAVSPEVGAAIRGMLGQIQSTQLESYKRRVSYLDTEQSLREKVQVLEREMAAARDDAAKKLGLDPGKCVLNIDTLEFQEK